MLTLTRHYIVVGLSWVCVLLLSGCQSEPENLNDFMTKLERDGFSGAILIERDGELIQHQAYGYASCADTVENTVDTVFAIGSITKDFTAAAIALLDGSGLLNVNAPIGNYLAGVPEDKSAITVQQLLEHRSGLATYHETGNLGDFEIQNKNEALNEIFSNELLFAPGTDDEYSNSGYTLLAMIIEAVSGQHYQDYIRQNLLGPAGMDSTGFWGESFSPMASTENTVVGCSAPETWQYSWVLVGNGGMVSTVYDLKRWIDALRGDELLDDATKRKFGYYDKFENTFGTAGGSSQHEFNATIEYSNSPTTLVVSISNRDTVRAESIASTLLRSAQNTVP